MLPNGPNSSKFTMQAVSHVPSRHSMKTCVLCLNPGRNVQSPWASSNFPALIDQTKVADKLLIISTQRLSNLLVSHRARLILLIQTRKLICNGDKPVNQHGENTRWRVTVNEGNESTKSRQWRVLPSRSAPSSTSPMRSFPADDSSSNRESVLRSNARFSMPLLVGVLHRQRKGEYCNYYHVESSKTRCFLGLF